METDKEKVLQSILAYGADRDDTRAIREKYPVIAFGHAAFVAEGESGKTCTLHNFLIREEVVSILKELYPGGCVVICEDVGRDTENRYWRYIRENDKDNWFSWKKSMSQEKWKRQIQDAPRDSAGKKLRRLIIVDDMLGDDAKLRSFLNRRITKCRNYKNEFAHLWLSTQKFTTNLPPQVRTQVNYWFFFRESFESTTLSASFLKNTGTKILEWPGLEPEELRTGFIDAFVHFERLGQSGRGYVMWNKPLKRFFLGMHAEFDMDEFEDPPHLLSPDVRIDIGGYSTLDEYMDARAPSAADVVADASADAHVDVSTAMEVDAGELGVFFFAMSHIHTHTHNAPHTQQTQDGRSTP